MAMQSLLFLCSLCLIKLQEALQKRTWEHERFHYISKGNCHSAVCQCLHRPVAECFVKYFRSNLHSRLITKPLFLRCWTITRRKIMCSHTAGFRASAKNSATATALTGGNHRKWHGSMHAGITEWMQPRQPTRRKPSYAGTGIAPMGMQNMSRGDQNLAQMLISRLTMGRML